MYCDVVVRAQALGAAANAMLSTFAGTEVDLGHHSFSRYVTYATTTEHAMMSSSMS